MKAIYPVYPYLDSEIGIESFWCSRNVTVFQEIYEKRRKIAKCNAVFALPQMLKSHENLDTAEFSKYSIHSG